MKLRPYQQKAIQDTRQALAQGYKNIAVCLSVGAGKSLVAKTILDLAAQKGKKIAFFSYRLILIEQIKSYGIPNCDVGTLQKHGKEPTEMYDLVIVDESWSEGGKLKNNINTKYMITLSGTPIDAAGYKLKSFDYIVAGVQLPDLIELGYAKRIKVISASNYDTSSIKKTGGDYSVGDSFDFMNKSKIYHDIVGAYKKYCIGRKVMAFAVNTKHAENLAVEFNNAGIRADAVHSKRKDMDLVLERFDSGDLDIVVSIAKLNVGYDNPSVDCVMLCRPTKSIPVMIQTVGRCTRLYDGKPEALILDLANVIEDTQHPMQKIDLNREKPKRDKNIPQHCNKDMAKIESKIMPIDKYEYCIYTKWKCDCGEIKEVQEIKLINPKACESCGKEIDQETEKETYIDNSKKLQFGYLCPHCGVKIPLREIEYSSEELKEIAYNSSTWEDVHTLLKIEAKACGYHYRWVDRAIDTLKNKGKCVDEVISYIKHLKEQNKKIGRVVYL
jgi:DNA repair protein RadD